MRESWGFIAIHLIGQHPTLFNAASLRNPVISAGGNGLLCYSEFGVPFTDSLISPIQCITAGVERIVEDVVGPFAKELIEDLEQGVHSKDDAYSLLSFMPFKYTPSTSLPIPRVSSH
ncbi:hypothetical protein EDB19DRAFT_1803242 [Suillus lakei]|nr:hypothetical protein EDB19DRAFT_1803242 [Suillus lakei]